MRVFVLVAIALAVVVAFRAGARWRHNSLTWSDHSVARGKERVLRKARWTTLRLAITGVVFMAAVVTILSAAGVAFTTSDDQPAKPSPSPSCAHPANGCPSHEPPQAR